MKNHWSLAKFFPFITWWPFSAGQLRADLLAGITVALVLIPQAMAYAQLAGLPPYYGLYASFLPVIVGALWGSSRQLATGPVAVVSLLTASALMPLAGSPEHYVTLAILLALLVGIIQLALGIFRLGAVVNLLSHPVIMGFTNAAAIIIGLSQLNKLLGVSITRSDNFINDIWGVLQQAGDTHGPTLAMGVGALAIMLLMKRFLPKWPNVLVAVVLTTTVSWQIGFEKNQQVGIDAFEDVALRTLVADYVNSQAHMQEIESGIVTLRETLRQLERETAKNPAKRVAHADYVYNLEIAELQLADAQRENKARWRKLSSTHYVLVPGAAGQIGLVRRDVADTEEFPVWRLQKIDAKGVQLMGGGKVIGAIPPGLPALGLPTIRWADVISLLAIAFVITLVAFMEAISIAKAMAAKTRARIDPNRELIGQGLANLVSAGSQGYPVSGSFSRSAINLGAGAVTGMASVFSGLLVMLTLLFFTGLLYHLPQAVLAAVIMLAVSGLVNFGALRHAWAVHWHDGLAATITFVATLAFAPHLDMGILSGAIIAIMLFVHRRMRPRAEILGQHPDGVLGGLDTHKLAPLSEKLVPVRFDGELTFVNVSHFEDMLLETLHRFPKVEAILLIGSSINEIDVSGEEKLSDMARRLEQVGVKLYVSGLKKQVMEVLERADIYVTLPVERFFPSKDQALPILLKKYG